MEKAISKFYEDLSFSLAACPDNNERIIVLGKRFRELSKTIFNGHFYINEEYEIHPLDIEFYFHEEGDKSLLKEPQMYHKGKEMPFFPQPYSICPNRSGVDVAFENEGQGIRASFLIRGYEYIDKETTYINKDGKTLSKDADGIISERFKPQYLWEDLFGNASMKNGLSIIWRSNDVAHDWDIKASPRINVNPIPGETERLWRFTNIEYLMNKS